VIIVLLPAVINYYLEAGNFIHATHYGGRLGTWWGEAPGRLLLGFFHPKEAGYSVLIVGLIAKFLCIHQSRFMNYGLNIFLLIFLTLVGSRNAVLFYVNFLIFSFVFNTYGYKRLMLGGGIVLFYLALIFGIFFDSINKLAGDRLQEWFEVMLPYMEIFGPSKNAFLQFLLDWEFSVTVPKFHMDSFFIEYMMEQGLIPGLVLLGMLFAFSVYLQDFKVKGIYINAVYLPYLFSNLFDSGIFSTGNYLAIFVWSYLVYGLNLKWETRHRLAQQKPLEGLPPPIQSPSSL